MSKIIIFLKDGKTTKADITKKLNCLLLDTALFFQTDHLSQDSKILAMRLS